MIKYIIGIINAICLIVFLFGFSIQTPALGIWFFEYQFEKNNSYDVVKMDKENLRYVSERIIDYLKGKNPTLEDVNVIVNGRERLFFNQKEIMHMEDVKVMFEIGLLVKNIAAVGFLATSIYFLLSKKTFKPLMMIWRCFAAGFLILIGVLGVTIALNFSRIFRLFHEISFSNDLWLLNPATDLMINILPSIFFQDIAMLIVAIFSGSLVAIIILTFVLRRK